MGECFDQVAFRAECVKGGDDVVKRLELEELAAKLEVGLCGHLLFSNGLATFPEEKIAVPARIERGIHGVDSDEERCSLVEAAAFHLRPRQKVDGVDGLRIDL